MTEIEKKPYNRYAADKKYDDANARRYGLKLIRKSDADIIEQLDRQPSVQAYIKRLVREDIARTSQDRAWTFDEVQRLVFSLGGTMNDMFVTARRSSYQDPDHDYVVCLIDGGCVSIIRTGANHDLPVLPSIRYIPMKVYTSRQNLTPEQIEDRMNDFQPIADRLDATSQLFDALRAAESSSASAE